MRLALLLALAATAAAADLRLGIIGTDTSHAVAFTRILNDPKNPDHVPGARVVAAFKGGSPDVESSRARVEGFAEELRTKWQVEIVPDISTLCAKVDAILLESVDGRAHLPQFRQTLAARKPVFIDKPLASTLEDAREIARLAREHGIPWFSTSSLRYSGIVAKLNGPGITGAITWGPGPTEEHHYLDLSWYGIHPVEMLFTLMGPGCEEVSRVSGADSDEVTCRWRDGRLGSVRTLRPYGGYGAVVFRGKQAVQGPEKYSTAYADLLRDVVRFFETKQPPVPNEVTLEIFAFLDAAQRSKEGGGKPVRLR